MGDKVSSFAIQLVNTFIDMRDLKMFLKKHFPDGHRSGTVEVAQSSPTVSDEYTPVNKNVK